MCVKGTIQPRAWVAVSGRCVCVRVCVCVCVCVCVFVSVLVGMKRTLDSHSHFIYLCGAVYVAVMCA